MLSTPKSGSPEEELGRAAFRSLSRVYSNQLSRKSRRGGVPEQSSPLPTTGGREARKVRPGAVRACPHLSKVLKGLRGRRRASLCAPSAYRPPALPFQPPPALSSPPPHRNLFASPAPAGALHFRVASTPLALAPGALIWFAGLPSPFLLQPLPGRLCR